MEKSKFFEIEVITNNIRKVKMPGKQGVLCNFDYSDLAKAKDVFLSKNLIYLIKADEESPTIYVGQTTQGVNRFEHHHQMKDLSDSAEIFFYDFEQDPSRNILDYLEKTLISYMNKTKYKVKNKNKGLATTIGGADKQFANLSLKNIIDLLKIFKINIEDSIEEKIDKNKKDENIFFINKKDCKATIIRSNDWWILKKGSIIKANEKWKEYEDDKKPFLLSSIEKIYKMYINKVDKDGLVKEDLSWKYISPIVAFALGANSANGWTTIKNKEGKTPDQVYRLG